MGALSIRLPASLHERIRQLAEQEGISINQFIVLAAAEKATLLEATGLGAEYLAARAARAADRDDDPRGVFHRYVAEAPDVDPPAVDRRSDAP